MTAPGVTILYEDQGNRKQGFGLHALVKACVFDVVDGERYRVEGSLRSYLPLKGVSNVLKECRENFDIIAADGRSVVAVIDDDKVRGHLRLPKTAPDDHVEREIKRGCPAPERLFIALLKKNTESVLEAAAACNPTHNHERMERAVRHKDLFARDAILSELAWERARAQRDCILGKMPSLKTLVDVLASMLLPGEAPAKASGAAPPPAPVRKQRSDVKITA
jgi:hypothetical protein